MRNALLGSFLLTLTLPATARLSEESNGARHLSEVKSVTLLDPEGGETSLGSPASVLVLAYTGVGCPISGKYAPRLARLARTYAAKGVRFVGINACPQDSPKDIREEQEELRLGFPVLKDLRQELTRALDARTTTEVFLFDRAGALRYRGAVDDQYSLGAARPEPTVHHLVNALEAVLAKGPIEEAETDAPGCLLTILPEEEQPDLVTYARDIAPILRNHCEVCHRPGQVGPFALQTYEQARGWGEMIASVVSERRMPPWNAAERFDGHFANERRLRAQERDLIARWVAEGMPRGNPNETLAAAHWPEGWRLGEPDAVFEMEREYMTGNLLPAEGYEVPRDGTVEYQYFSTETHFADDRWIRSLEILPGAADVVHHVVIAAIDPSNGSASLERALLSYLGVAVPGDTPSIYPEGYAKLLPAGSTLIFQVHYTPNGKQRFDRSRLALTFAEEPPIFEVVSEAILNQAFLIPAGAENFEVRFEHNLPEDTGVISFFPHMHKRGKDFTYIAHYPDGGSEELLSVDYDFNWQETYVYPDPVLLPSGTRIECIAHFDNSAGNPNNPDPGSAVRWGEQTWEEMFVGYFDKVVPVDS